MHPHVLRHCPPARLAGLRVLLPSCRWTRDLLWFREHGRHVVAVEPGDLAIARVLAESRLPFARHADRYEAERLTVFRRRPHELTPEDVGPIDLVYDRPALAAVWSRRHVAAIDGLTRPGSAQLVTTLEHAAGPDATPPSISPADMARHYGRRWRIEHAGSRPLPDHRLARHLDLDPPVEHAFALRRLDA